ncbi:MAG: FAD-dependent oxidoreductase [Methylococcales bacterium]|nr:FAD-dependent oxidoreductase [Methylococcales bacterium]
MKIVIIGGVAAGASTAARARRLNEDAEIIVLEKDAFISFANCGLPYHISGEIKDRNALLLQTPKSLKQTLNIDVRVSHEVTQINRQLKQLTIVDHQQKITYTESYEKLVLCQGADALRPPIPGIDHQKIFVLRNIPDMDAIIQEIDEGARKAIVIGGGFIGIEVAEAFRQRNMVVELVELQNQLMPPFDYEMACDLRYHMESKGVQLHLGHAAKKFTDAGGKVEVVLDNGHSLTADLVVLAIGVRPASNLAVDAELAMGDRGGIIVDEHMQTSAPDIYAAGDMVEVTDTVTGTPTQLPLAGPANRQGRIVADNIFGLSSQYRSTQGTAVVKVFDMTAGSTGASEKTLQRVNRAYHKVYLHPSGHAGYYPGTAPMHIKLLFEPESGKLLGAQVVGYDGVDKRIDVFATAIFAGLTVFDLEHLELAYAPPYGSAKDPVNMAGFIASNFLRGDLDFWYAENFPEQVADGILIDVRSSKEFKNWSIPGSINIPLRELRSRLDEIEVEKRIYVYCRVGFRSYLAYRILKQKGFKKVAMLAGGSKTFNCFCRTQLATGKAGVPFVSYAEEKLAKIPGAMKNA